SALCFSRSKGRQGRRRPSHKMSATHIWLRNSLSKMQAETFDSVLASCYFLPKHGGIPIFGRRHLKGVGSEANELAGAVVVWRGVYNRGDCSRGFPKGCGRCQGRARGADERDGAS